MRMKKRDPENVWEKFARCMTMNAKPEVVVSHIRDGAMVVRRSVLLTFPDGDQFLIPADSIYRMDIDTYQKEDY